MDYRDDPLWKQAVELQAEACRYLFSFADRSTFESCHEDLANVVLAYFDGKTTGEMVSFADALKKLAMGYGETTIFSYKCNADADEGQRYIALAEVCVNDLWEKKHRNLEEDTDGGKNSEKKLNVFERILNRCVLFLKGK